MSASTATPAWNTFAPPTRTVKVRMRKRRSPSASGTSLRIAIANENGTTTIVSAHTAAGIATVPSPNASEKCA